MTAVINMKIEDVRKAEAFLEQLEQRLVDLTPEQRLHLHRPEIMRLRNLCGVTGRSRDKNRRTFRPDTIRYYIRNARPRLEQRIAALVTTAINPPPRPLTKEVLSAAARAAQAASWNTSSTAHRSLFKCPAP